MIDRIIFLLDTHTDHTFTTLVDNDLIIVSDNPGELYPYCRGSRLKEFVTNFSFKNKFVEMYYGTIMPSLVVLDGKYREV